MKLIDVIEGGIQNCPGRLPPPHSGEASALRAAILLHVVNALGEISIRGAEDEVPDDKSPQIHELVRDYLNRLPH